jgi:DNA-binding transcriptional ArsR family regulator
MPAIIGNTGLGMRLKNEFTSGLLSSIAVEHIILFDQARTTAIFCFVNQIVEQPDLSGVTLETALQALADETRLEIVRQLASSEVACACGSFGLDVSKATRSHHFKTLREAGITNTEIDGTKRLVTLRREEFDERFPGLLDAVLAPVAVA